MERVYRKPTMIAERFEASEYVAACYKIKCTTPNNNGTFYRIVEDTNKNGIYDNGDRRLYSSRDGFHGCGRWHSGVIRNDPPTVNGFVVGKDGRNVQPIFWWSEDLGGNTVDYHVMTPGEENYETNPNAS